MSDRVHGRKPESVRASENGAEGRWWEHRRAVRRFFREECPTTTWASEWRVEDAGPSCYIVQQDEFTGRTSCPAFVTVGDIEDRDGLSADFAIYQNDVVDEAAASVLGLVLQEGARLYRNTDFGWNARDGMLDSQTAWECKNPAPPEPEWCEECNGRCFEFGEGGKTIDCPACNGTGEAPQERGEGGES